MSRTPTQLAALAGSAVSGLDPVTVRAGRDEGRRRSDVAFVTDTQRRTWVIRAPRTPAAGAQLETAVTLLGHLGRRLPFSVPAPRGFVAVPEGRAMVYPAIHGRTVVLAEVPPGPGVAAEIGRAVAAIHNIDPAVFDDAGMPSYDPDAWRTRRLADLDRAAATGHVPTPLLGRWERALENVPLWRFAATPVHGDLTGNRILVTFSDEQDSTTASIRGINGWEDARVGDPADDLAAVVEQCSPAGAESILEAYALARIERPDRNLRRRATLSGELRQLTDLLEAVGQGDAHTIGVRAAQLRDLDERLADQPEDLEPEPTPEQHRSRPVVVSTGVFDASASQVHGVTDAQDIQGVEGVEDSGGAEGAEAMTDGDGPADLDEADVTGPVRRGPLPESAAPAAEDDLDQSEHTQILRAGERAEETTVIPDEELSRLRLVSDHGRTVQQRSGPDASTQDAHDPAV